MEHEALQQEIEAVQKDPRFRAAMERDPEELMTLAWYHELDSLDGYLKPLTEEEQKVVDAAHQLEAEEKEKARAAEEKEKQRQKEEEDRKVREKAEEDKREQERLRKEAEQKKFLEENKQLFDIYHEDLRPQVEELTQPLRVALYGLDSDEDIERCRELAATLVALNEIQRGFLDRGEKIGDPWVNKAQLRQRVDELKKDPIIRKLGDKLRDGKYVIRQLGKYDKQARELNNYKGYSERQKATYPVIRLSKDMWSDFTKQADERAHPKPEKKRSIADGYEELKKPFAKVIDGALDYKKAVPTIALAVTLQEMETKSGLDGPLDKLAFATRFNQIKDDPLILAVSQSLKGPTGQEGLENALKNSPNREQAFAGFLDGMYKKAILDKQQAQEAKKEQEGPKEINEEPKEELLPQV